MTPESLAFGRPCEFSPLPNYKPCVDADDVIQLTDGVYDSGTDPIWFRKSTVGWNKTGSVSAMITVDLGSVRPICGFSFSYAAGSAGVGWPDLAYVYVRESEEEDWRYVGDLIERSAEENGPPKKDRYAVCRARSEKMFCRGRYVAFLVRSQNYIFTDEIEVYRGDDALLSGEQKGLPVSDPLSHLKMTSFCNRLLRDLDRIVAAADGIEAARREAFDIAVARLRKRVENLSGESFDPQDLLTVLPLNDVHRDIYVLNAVVMRSAGIVSPVLWTNNRWDNLDPLSVPDEGQRMMAVPEVRMMRGETRSTAVNVANPTRRPLTFSVSADGFPEAANVECREVVFTDTKMRTAVSGALRNGAKSIEMTVPAGANGQVWITFRRPTGAAGTFSGEIVFRAAGQGTLRKPVTLILYDLDFPSRPRLHVGGWDYSTGDCTTFHAPGNAAANQAMMRSLHVDTYFAGWDPVRPKGAKFDESGALVNAAELDFSGWDDWVARFPDARYYSVFPAVDVLKENGRNVFEGEPVGTARFARMVEDYFAAWAGHLRRKGISPSRVQFQLVDEPGEWRGDFRHLAELVVAWAKPIKRADSEFVIFEDPDFSGDPAQAGAAMYEASDIICPKTEAVGNPKSALQRDFFRDWRRKGKRLWLYSCQGSSREMDPVSYYRQQFWLAFQLGAEGSAYWAFGCGGGIGDSWHAYRQTGVEYSPYFVSPTDVMASKQSEGLREGVEDYECLMMLSDALADARKAGKDVKDAEAALRAAVRMALNQSGVGDECVRADDVLWSVEKDRSCVDRAHAEVLRALTCRLELAEGTLALPPVSARIYSTVPGLWQGTLVTNLTEGITSIEQTKAAMEADVQTVLSNEVVTCTELMRHSSYPPWHEYETAVWGGYVWNRSPTNETWTFGFAVFGYSKFYLDGAYVRLTDDTTKVLTSTLTVTPGPHRILFKMNPRNYWSAGSTPGSEIRGSHWKDNFGFVLDRWGRGSVDCDDYIFPENGVCGNVSGGDGFLFTRDDCDVGAFSEAELAKAARGLLTYPQVVAKSGTTLDLGAGNACPLPVDSFEGVTTVRNGSILVEKKWTVGIDDVKDGGSLSVADGGLSFADGATVVFDGGVRRPNGATTNVFTILKTRDGISNLPDVTCDCAKHWKFALSADGRSLTATYVPLGLSVIVS